MNRKGHIARASRLKRLALRNKQDLSDLASNTRKRRRLARRLFKEQPLFAFHILSQLIKDYSVTTFIRDIRPTRGTPGKSRPKSARMEFHDELLQKVKSGDIDNKTVTRLHINWEHRSKPFTYHAFGIIYTFPRNWRLKQIRHAAIQMQQAKDLQALDKIYDQLTSYGN